MDPNLTDSQRILIDSARDFLRIRADGQAADSPDVLGLNPSDPDAVNRQWQRMSALGWSGLMVDEAHGGVGGQLIDAVLLVEQMGLVALASPYIEAALVAPVLIAGLGSARQRQSLLGPIAEGSCVHTLAVCEDEGAWSLANMRASTSGERSLTGRKLFIRHLDVADQVLVICRRPSQTVPIAIRVATGTLRANNAITATPSLSGDVLGTVEMSGLCYDEDAVLGSESTDDTALRRAICVGAVASAAEMVGLAQRALDICVEHAKVRVQSGQPIGAFQAIQHHCADMLRDVEGARFMTYRAAWAYDRVDDWETQAAMAKAYASDACLAVVRKGHQVLGAIGYCDDHPLHRLHKRIHAASLAYGDSTEHLDVLAGTMAAPLSAPS